MKNTKIISIAIIFLAGMLFTIGEAKQSQNSNQVKAAAAVKLASEPVGGPDSKADMAMIKFENKIHDFGEIAPGSKNLVEFHFKNAGTEELKITKVTKTCGCTPFSLEKKVYAPGEKGKIKVQYKAGQHAGKSSKRLYVFSNDPTDKRVELIIKADIVPRVESKPKMLKLSLNEKNAGISDIVINSVDGKEFSIKKVSSTAGVINADHDADKEARKFVLKPDVDMDKLKKNLRGRVTVELTHPETKEVNIPFKALPMFQTTPARINLFNVQPGDEIEKTLWVLSNYEQAFEIESLESDKGAVTVTNKEKMGNRYKLTLVIEAPKNESKRFFRDQLNIKVKDNEDISIVINGFLEKE